MTGNGIESDFVLPDSLSYRIIAHFQLSISILAQTVDFFAQLAYRRIHLRLLLPEPEALPLDSAKGVFDPLDSHSRDWVAHICILSPRVYSGNP